MQRPLATLAQAWWRKGKNSVIQAVANITAKLPAGPGDYRVRPPVAGAFHSPSPARLPPFSPNEGWGSLRRATEPSVLPAQFTKKQHAGSGQAERKNQNKAGVFSREDAPPPSLGCRQHSVQNCTAAWSNSKIVLLDYNVPIFQIYSHFQYYSLWH